MRTASAVSSATTRSITDLTGCPCHPPPRSGGFESKSTDSHINNCPLAGKELDILARDLVRFRYSEEMNVAYPYNSGQSCQSHPSSGSECPRDLTVLNVMRVQRMRLRQIWLVGVEWVRFFSRSGLKQVHSLRKSFSNKHGLLIGTVRNLLHPLDKYPRTTMRTTRRQNKQ